MPAKRPVCYGKPEHCTPCRGCALRAKCYAKQVRSNDVFLLPLSRPVRHRATFGSSFTREYTPKEHA